jgi:glycosyltransferase involved in cell wall biosynthesis
MGSSLQAAACENNAIPSTATVAVLLCSLNGDRYLDEQLESIGRQQGVRVCVHVSDDGSNDKTHRILDKYRELWGEERMVVRRGPGQGYVANFFSLICASIEADYFAYSDQDDIWESDKLSRAICALSSLPHDRPAIYCSRTRLVSRAGKPIGLSPLFCKPPTFANALIQNIGGGNTMVLNHRARDLLRAAGPVDVVSHDWWTYILVAGSGGTVIYDPHPSVSYRQHQDNLIGSSMTWGDRLTRFSLMLRGRKRAWNTKNVSALQQNRGCLTPENIQILEEFCRARDASLIPRLLGIWRSGVYAQCGWGSVGLLVTTFLKKL